MGVLCVVCCVLCVVCCVLCVVCCVWCVVCCVWCVVCGVWCVVCGVWCVVCGVDSGKDVGVGAACCCGAVGWDEVVETGNCVDVEVACGVGCGVVCRMGDNR